MNLDNVNSSIIDSLSFAEFSQHNNVENCVKRILDLVFSTKVNLLVLNGSDICLVRPNYYHPPIKFYLEYETIKLLRETISRFHNFRKENYTELNQFFLNTNWINILEGKSIGENVQAFNGVLAGRQITYSKSKNKKYPLFFPKTQQNV